MIPEPTYRFEPAAAVTWEFVIVVVFPVLGAAAAVWFFREVRRSRRLTRKALWGAAFSLFLPVLAIDAGWSIHTAYSLSDRGEWLYACGPVDEFSTEDRVNTGYESFTVSGVRFRYSDHGPPSGLGYHRTQGRGGLFRPNLRVRIAYVPLSEHNVIVRVEPLATAGSAACGPP